MAELDLNESLVAYRELIEVAAQEGLDRGGPGQWMAVVDKLRRRADLDVRPGDELDDRIQVECRVWNEALSRYVRRDVRRQIAEQLDAYRAGEGLPEPNPWYAVHPAEGRKTDEAIARGIATAERRFLLSLRNFRTSGRFSDLDQATRALINMSQVEGRIVVSVRFEGFEMEENCLVQAMLDTMSSAACAFLVDLVRVNYGDLAGDEELSPPGDSADEDRGSDGGHAVKWVTAGGWFPTVMTPDVKGSWFVSSRQRRFRREQKQWRERLDEDETQRRREGRREKAAVRKAARDKEKQANAKQAAAQAEARAAQEVADAAATERAKAAAEKQRLLDEAEHQRQERADRENKDLMDSIERERIEENKIIATELENRGIDPTPIAIRRERQARGADRGWVI